MRILLAAFGTRGDVQPFLVLAYELRRRGHDAVFCTPPDFTGWLRAHGFEAHAVGTAYRSFVTTNAGNILATLPLLRREVVPQGRALEPFVAGADVVLAAGPCAAAGPVAEKHGVPYRFSLLSPSMLPSRDHPAPHVGPQAMPRWLNGVSWSLYEAAWGAIFRGPVREQRAELGLAPPKDLWRTAMGSEVFLVADPVLAPVPADVPLAVRPFGAFFFDDPTPLPDDLERFLSAGPPPVYVGFGSMGDARPAETVRTLVEATERTGVRVIVARGWAGLATDPGPRIHLVDETSRAKLFPRCAGVVHHGGAGTTQAAARAGVPQLLVPHLLDQFYWAGRVRAEGIGVEPVTRGRLGAARLAEALRTIVDDDALRARPRAFAGRMAADGVTRAADVVEALGRR